MPGEKTPNNAYHRITFRERVLQHYVNTISAVAGDICSFPNYIVIHGGFLTNIWRKKVYISEAPPQSDLMTELKMWVHVEATKANRGTDMSIHAFLTLARDGLEQFHAPAVLPTEKDPSPPGTY